MIRRSGAVGRILVRSIAEHDLDAPPSGIDALLRRADLRPLPAAAAFHGVTGHVYHSVKHCPSADATTVATLRHNYHQARLVHLRTLADLASIGPAFDALGVPWLVAKGPVLAEAVYARPDLRTYTDLDIFVPPAWFGRALATLEDLGGRVLDRNWDELRERMYSEVHVVAPHGTLVELHFHLLNESAARQIFTVPMAQLYDRARRVRVGRTVVPTLDAVDTLVYVSLHACVSGADRLIWLKDVERAAAAVADWDDVVRRSQQFRAPLAVGFMLQAARDVLDIDMPPRVVRDLVGSALWRGMGDVTRQLWPTERGTYRRSPTRLLARSTRCDPRSTTVAAARNSLAALQPARRGDGWLPLATGEPVGSRDRFLAEVAASERGDGRAVDRGCADAAADRSQACLNTTVATSHGVFGPVPNVALGVAPNPAD